MQHKLQEELQQVRVILSGPIIYLRAICAMMQLDHLGDVPQIEELRVVRHVDKREVVEVVFKLEERLQEGVAGLMVGVLLLP